MISHNNYHWLSNL